jgi:hypothetical protein
MGCPGNGRIADPENRKRRVEEAISIDIAELFRKGALEKGSIFRLTGHFQGPDAVPQTYYLLPRRAVGDDRPVGPCGGILVIVRVTPTSHGEYKIAEIRHVRIVTSQLHHGGSRHWLACPGLGSGPESECGRRVASLYLPAGAATFACRVCHGLTNLVQQVPGSALKKRRPLSWRMSRRWRRQVLGTGPDAHVEARPLDGWPVELGRGKHVPAGRLSAVCAAMRRVGLRPGHILYDCVEALIGELESKANTARRTPGIPRGLANTLARSLGMEGAGESGEPLSSRTLLDRLLERRQQRP